VRGAGVIVVVTGSRTWTDRRLIAQRLAGLPAGSIVIHGGAAGADRIAHAEARRLDLESIPVPAQWRRYGKPAGMIRNAAMLDTYGPELVLAFRAPGHSPGTDGMIDLARRRGIPVEVVTP
jgi:hypothetical protein